MKEKIAIDKSAVARAVRASLEIYYKAIEVTGYDREEERAGNWEENDELRNAIGKSKYASRHLDWFYVVMLVHVVLDSHPRLTPVEFAEELEKLIIATSDHRDYLAIFPLSFQSAMDFLPPILQKSVVRRRTIGKFTISPAAPSLKALNKIVSKHGFPLVSDSSFQHAMRTSNDSLSREMIVTFDIHGAEDQLRLSAESEFTFFRRLIEIFGCLFGGESSCFDTGISVNHFFLLNKVTGEFRRQPTRTTSVIDLPLSASLFRALERSTFKDFLSDAHFSTDPMYGRLRNAIKFFSMALNADGDVASFLFYVIAMESIFSRDKNNPIKVTLADLGAMLCFPSQQRLKAHERIRRAYDLRSAIVHSGRSSVARKDVEAVKELAARAIYASLFLCHQLATGQGKLEDRFFDHLRDQKLGLTKVIAPRELWELPETRDVDDE